MSLRAQRGPVRAALKSTLDELRDLLNDAENQDRERIGILFRRSKRHMDKLQDLDVQVNQHLLHNDASEEEFTDEYTAVNLYRDEYDELEQRALRIMKTEVAIEQRIPLAKEGFKIQDEKSPWKKMENFEEIPTATNMLSGQGKDEKLCIFCDKKHESSGCYQANSMMNEDEQKRVRDNKACFVCLQKEQVSRICKMKPYCPICQINDEIKMTHGLSGGTETKENHNVFKLRVGNCDNTDPVNLTVLEQTRISRRVSRLPQEVRVEEVESNSIITTDAESDQPEIHPLVGTEFAEALVIQEPTRRKDEEVMVDDVIQQSQDSIDVNEYGKYEVAVSSLECPSSVAENMETAVRRLVVTMRKLESQEYEDWRHIPGKDSPADLTSRECNGKQLVESRRWEGPEWLYQPWKRRRRYPLEVGG
ncbi:unnamed protein product [Orchesella dallaii]|uniref:Uncharacterized protein n=1 Tax=Orchesella dallaii TaxID=48710 RepID=A0ABP1PQ18_9HEXA